MNADEVIRKIEESQRKERVFNIKLYERNIDIVRWESKTSLVSPKNHSIRATGFDQKRCADAAFMRGLPFEILAKRRSK